jgi:hypothetical protein
MAESNAAGFDIEKAEREYNEARADVDEPTDDELDDGVDGNEAPPGFLSFQEYTAQGGDPDMYRGRKAFENEHDRIEENKRLRKDIKGFQNTVQQTMEAVNEWKGNERTKMRAEVEASLHRAMEDEDPQAAIDAQKKLDAIDDTPAVQRPEHPMITEFRSEHPLLDESSDDFDQELNADVEAFFNNMATQLSQGNRRQLTDGQVTRVLRKALKDAFELRIEASDEVDDVDDDKPIPGESPRNTRGRGKAAPKRRARQQPAKPKAEAFVLDNPMNERQTHAASEVRDTIREKSIDAGRKAGLSDADAKKRADEDVKRFEESLFR